MPVVARFDHHVYVGHLDRDIVEQAAMVNLDDVATGITEKLCHLRQCSGRIGQRDPQADHPAS